MFFWLANLLAPWHHVFHAFTYVTLRAILAALTALLLSFMIGPSMIRKLTALKVGQQVRDDGPKSHLSKAGTPTMGGALMLISITIATLLWADLTNPYVWLVLLVTIGFGLIGFWDDYRKLVLKNSKGLPAKWKYFWQSLIGLIAACYLYSTAQDPVQTSLFIPFFKTLTLNLGWFFIPFVYFVIVGSSNAVNLTDGLDGLATLPTVMVAGALGIFTYVTGSADYARYLDIAHIKNVSEVVIFCASLVGAGLGFLWYNAYPALVFMGDVGSLSLGAALGIIAVVIRQELVLLLMGGIFVAETFSVILQVGYFKMTRKRIFRMAPLHHHFELKGWPESRVIVRFWIITFVLVLCGLATLKLR